MIFKLSSPAELLKTLEKSLQSATFSKLNKKEVLIGVEK